MTPQIYCYFDNKGKAINRDVKIFYGFYLPDIGFTISTRPEFRYYPALRDIPSIHFQDI